MELLAPVGNTDNFFAAVEAGADAVYVGAPGFNARNISKELSLAEIAGMIEYCHKKNLKIYLASNSLILEKELPHVIKTLSILQELGPDGLIVQDVGLLRLVKKYFPELPVHASTLMAAHNVDSVKTLQAMGFERVVLAREMTLAEIETISKKTDVELEIFIHGAMCYSYSGLCLFSSYFGGKSGLRGNCVQPCRRAYTYSGASGRGNKRMIGKSSGKKEYLFSMNDLNGLEVVPELKACGVSSLKIEGRLRSAKYVSNVVSAYRKVLDASDEDFEKVLPQAQDLLESAMSRKLTPGYFHTQRPDEIISVHHSGNIGLFLGQLQKINDRQNESLYSLKLHNSLGIGDRVRIHDKRSGERYSVNVTELQVEDQQVERAREGENVLLVLPQDKIPKQVKSAEMYKVDVADKDGENRGEKLLNLGRQKTLLGQIEKKKGAQLNSLVSRVYLPLSRKQIDDKQQKGNKLWKKSKKGFGKKKVASKPPLEIWLRTDSLKTLLSRLPFNPDRVVINVNEQLVNQAGLIKRALGAKSKTAIWALPPVISDRDTNKVRKLITTLMRNGFRSFQLGHLGQGQLFGKEKVHFFGDYTLNVLNSESIRFAMELGLEAAQISVESDRESIESMIFGYKKQGIPTPKGGNPDIGLKIGMTLYGRPALYTSRLDAKHFHLGKKVVSPKNEAFVIQKKDNLVQTYPDKPFSLLPYQQELKGFGLDYGVIDMVGSHVSKKEMQEIIERLQNSGRFAKLSTFNYLGSLT